MYNIDKKVFDIFKKNSEFILIVLNIINKYDR